jgi:hypothetical protein
MSRNHLKHFPTAFLRRGMAHFHPGAWPAGRSRAIPPAEEAAPEASGAAGPTPADGVSRDRDGGA